MKRGKRYQTSKSKVERGNVYDLEEGISILKEFESSKFDETIDIAVSLGVNPKHADQMVRGTVVLPHGRGKKIKVLVLAKGEKEKEALESGADYVGSDDMIEKIKGGWLDFDKVVATPDMMGSVGKLGKILGPRGLMPNPKTGTVTFEIAKAIKELKAGKIDFRVEKAGIVHTAVGKKSFLKEQLKDNIVALLEVILRAKPASSKGQYLRGVAISPTMGPSIKLDVNKLRVALKA